ncbi:MAG: transposase [Pseudoalteromonas sp.]|uniref:transposase n=2 Tax=Pseudoalteromonas TaxID=53246 RepID=UPI001CE4A1C8
MELQRNTHHVFRIMYHLVWIPKYRHKVFSEPYRAEMKAIIQRLVTTMTLMHILMHRDHLILSKPIT